jgi:hypothetical protein
MHIEQACMAAQNNDTQGVLMNLTLALNALGNATQGNMTTTTTGGDTTATTTGGTTTATTTGGGGGQSGNAGPGNNAGQPGRPNPRNFTDPGPYGNVAR